MGASPYKRISAYHFLYSIYRSRHVARGEGEENRLADFVLIAVDAWDLVREA